MKIKENNGKGGVNLLLDLANLKSGIELNNAMSHPIRTYKYSEIHSYPKLALLTRLPMEATNVLLYLIESAIGPLRSVILCYLLSEQSIFNANLTFNTV